MKEIKLVLSNDIEEIKQLVSEGYCPVECSLGGESIVDDLVMDHHGEHSNLEAVSLRSYRDHYGARSEDPRFVTTGVADADCCFTVASLAGTIPHPDREVGELPPHIKASLTRDLTALAETIARVDVSPIGLNIPELDGGDILLTWNAMTSNARDSLGFAAGVGLWRSLLEGNPAQLNHFISAAKKAEEGRVNASNLDLVERGEQRDRVLLINKSRVFGFPEWYGRVEENPFEDATGWKNPVVLAWLENGQNVTIGCPNKEVAEQLFGQGGLKNVFHLLKPEGWGGREAVGGSPRGSKLSIEDVLEACKTISDSII